MCCKRLMTLAGRSRKYFPKLSKEISLTTSGSSATTVVFRGRDSRKLMTLKKSPSRSVTTSTSSGLP